MISIDTKFGFIYITVNKINGKKYIGKAQYGRKNDWQKYLGSGTYLKRAIKKYGRENFFKIIIDEASSENELRDIEEYYISMFNAVEDENFYNLKNTSIGGDTFTSHPEKERIRGMRIKQMSGEGNHQYGKPKTEKMIESVKKANSKPISIDGIHYPSIQRASEIIGIGATTISYRLSSKNFENYRRL